MGSKLLTSLVNRTNINTSGLTEMAQGTSLTHLPLLQGKKKSMSCLWVRTRYRVSPDMCPAASTWVANPAGSSPPCHPICTQSPSLITHPTRRGKDNPLGRRRQNLPTVTLERSTAEPHRGLSAELRPITQEASLAPNKLSSYPAFTWGAQGPPAISRPPTKFGAGLSKSSQYVPSFQLPPCRRA